jgi:flagellar assembly factor FliW
VIRLTTPFGEFEAAADSIVTFADGLPGFEQCRRFVVLSQPNQSPLVCLQAVDGAQAAFLAVDPRRILPEYRCVLGDADRQRLGADLTVTLLWLAILTIGKDEEIFANLRAPVVINPEKLVGLQAMPYDALYPLRHPIAPEALALTGTEGRSCSW